MRVSARPPARESGPGAPFGAAGPDTAPAAACRCGADPHPDHPDRCTAGHVLPGNLTAALVGHRGAAFWVEHATARRELREAVISDAGHDPGDSPPRALELAADGIAQAALVRDAAYLRLVAAGGPLTAAGRARRAFEVWIKAADRLERGLRMVGLRREPKPAPSLAETLAQRATAGERQ